MPVCVRRDAVDAAHLDDAALPAELLGEPVGAELPVGDLVIADHVGRGLRHCLVDGDDDDSLVGRLLDHRVQRVPVRRVDHDHVGAR